MRQRLELIQFSRAFVPLLVMLYHVSVNMESYWDYNLLGMSTLSTSGGVSYFFALSGFMLFYIYKDKLGKPGQIKLYLKNRFIRIYPLYWVLTSIALPIFIFFPFLSLGNEINYDSIVHSLLLIPHPDGTEPILDIAWSLIYTIYFYIIFTAFFLQKRIIPKVIVAIWVLVTLGFMTNILWSEEKIPYFFFYEFNFIFLAGILAAYLLNKVRINTKMAVIISGIGLIGFPLSWLNEFHEVVNISSDLSTGLASAVLIFGLATFDLQKKISLPNFLNYLGNASLSIYLAHNLPLNAFSHIFYKLGVFEVIGGATTSIILLALITCVGCLVHSFIEKPLITYMKSKLL